MRRAIIALLFICSTAWATEYNETVKIHKEVNPPDNPHVYQGDVFHNGLDIMDSHNVHFINCEIKGFIHLMDSYPEIGLTGIKFEGCYIHDATGDSYKKLVFMGGHNIWDVTFRDCKLLRCVAGTHAMYFSGAHWNKKDPQGVLYPPIRDIEVIGCHVSISAGGRHLIQFNGRFDGVKVNQCHLSHGQLGAISSIGVHNGTYARNVIYGCNRTPIVIYDYAEHWASQYNYFKTLADIQAFLEAHWPNENIKIRQNTIVVGPDQFCKDPWHNDDPKDLHPCIEVNNAVHSGFHFYDEEGNKKWMQIDYPNKDIVIIDNVLWTPSEICLDFKHDHEASETHLLGNMAWSDKTTVPKIRGSTCFKAMHGNFIMDPLFEGGLPEYDFIDMGDEQYKYEDWYDFKTAFNAYSRRAKKHGKGKPFPVPVFSETATKQEGEGFDLIEAEKEIMYDGNGD